MHTMHPPRGLDLCIDDTARSDHKARCTGLRERGLQLPPAARPTIAHALLREPLFRLVELMLLALEE
jgi:hypothetical protein